VLTHDDDGLTDAQRTAEDRQLACSGVDCFAGRETAASQCGNQYRDAAAAAKAEHRGQAAFSVTTTAATTTTTTGRIYRSSRHADPRSLPPPTGEQRRIEDRCSSGGRQMETTTVK